MLAKKQLDSIYNQVASCIEKFKFDSIILHKDEENLLHLLLEEKYQLLTCSDIATILPKLIKCSNFEDGHFMHIR